MTPRTEQGRLRPLARTLAIVLLMALVALALIDRLHVAFSDTGRALDDIAQRHARLAGVRDAAPRVSTALSAATQQMQTLSYPGDSTADRVGADLQQRVRNLASEHGLSVLGSQILAPRAEEGFQLIPLIATLDGDLSALHGLLKTMAQVSPAIRVEQLGIQQIQSRPGTEGHHLRIQLNLAAIQLQ